METKIKQRDIIFSILAISLGVWPFFPQTLAYIPYSPLVLMMTHYSLFTSGFILSYLYLRFNKWIGLLGILPVVTFHLPYFFSLSGAFLSWTFLDYASMFLSGVLIAQSVRGFSRKANAALFILYMIGDTVLSILFILGYPAYTSEEIPFSPYSPGQLVDTGIAMLIIMNAVMAYVLIYFLKRILGVS